MFGEALQVMDQGLLITFDFAEYALLLLPGFVQLSSVVSEVTFDDVEQGGQFFLRVPVHAGIDDIAAHSGVHYGHLRVQLGGCIGEGLILFVTHHFEFLVLSAQFYAEFIRLLFLVCGERIVEADS